MTLRILKMMKMNWIIFVLFILFQTYEAKVQDCGTSATIGKFSKVSVSSCDDEADKCILHKDHNATIGISFTTNKNVEKVKAQVHGKILSAEVPFELDNPDGCKDSGLDCPLNGGKDYTYHNSIFVKKIYPKVSVVVKWELFSENNEQIVCVLIPAKIQ